MADDKPALPEEAHPPPSTSSSASASASASSATVTTPDHDVESQQQAASSEKVTHWRVLLDQSGVTQEVLDYNYGGHGTVESPYLVEFIPGDRWNPMGFKSSFKWAITLVQASATLSVSFASSAYSGGISEIIKEFDISTEVAILGVSLFVVGFAIGPLIWAPLSELYGRQKTFFISYMALAAFSAGAAGANSMATLIVLRFFSGAFGSSPLTNAGGVIADLFQANQRGIAFSIFAMAPFLGPALGPIAGGFLGEAEGWRWVEGLIAIFTGVVWILSSLIYPETYAPVLLRQRAASLSKKTGKVYISKLDEGQPIKTVASQLSVSLLRPWLLLIKEPIVLLISLYMAIIYGSLYMCFAAFPIVFQQGRGWSPGIGGLAFTGIAIGMTISTVGSIFDNARYAKIAAKFTNGSAPPEARLPPAILGSILIPIGLFWFAWTNGPSVHWIVSIIGSIFFAAGIVLVFLSLMNYIVDSYVVFAASALAASSVLRSLFGAAFPLFTTYMYQNLGVHWASSVPAFLALACVPFPALFYKYGDRIRAKCEYAAEAAAVLARMQDKNVQEEDSDRTTKSTTASTPTIGRPCPYRIARELPHELKEHCQIFLEEQLYTCAINLLNSILGSGVSRTAPSGKPASVPPPSHLALLGTIAVHPLHTTRADKPEHLDVSSLALGYLRNVLVVVGPLHADFRTAFQFRSMPRWNRRAAHTGRGSDSDMSDDDSEGGHDFLRGRIANEGSVWVKGQDFWSTIGWAFHCCTLMPHRWRYWKAWLEFMVDVLADDWAERERRDQEDYETRGRVGDEPTTWRAESMMVMYMDQRDGRHSGPKAIAKALFAYSGSVSSSSFREVFDKEHKGPRPRGKKRKREAVLDLANDKFGDYFDEDESISSGVSEPPTPQKQRTKGDGAGIGAGMVESIHLRLRLFKLLSAVTYALRRSEIDRLYEDFAAGIKVLPLDIFALFVSQRSNTLLTETHITLTKELFHSLLPSSYKDPRKVDPEGDLLGSLTMPMLEHCYACYPANTIGLEDNAKLSLVVESAIQLLWTCDMMEYTDSFAAAVEKGIVARVKKAQKKRTGRTKADASDSHASNVMDASAERIQILLEVLRASAD
ncbi:major facilitator superfamily transporter [Trichoderma ceciliae]